MTTPNTGFPCYLEKKGNLRAMFYNVYGYDNDFPKSETRPKAYNGTRGGPIVLRHAMQMEIFEGYASDVMAFQEYVKTSHDILTPKLTAIGYREVPYTLPEGDKVNDTPIFYKESVLSLIEGGYHLYNEWVDGVAVSCNNSFTKSLSWAVFEQKSDSKQFVFVSTHLMYDAERDRNAYDRARCANVDELFAILDEVRTKYPHIPVIVGGDLNSFPDGAAFVKLQTRLTWMQEADGVNADTCGMKGYSTYSFEKQEYTGCPMPPPTGFGIDHAFFDGNISVLNYVTLTDRSSLLASDHCPKLADMILN